MTPPRLNWGSSSEPVLEQRHRQHHRQLGGSGAIHLVAEGQLVEEEVILGRQLAVLYLVFHVEGELALLDTIARILGGIRRQGRKLEVVQVGQQIEGQIA